MTTIKPQSLPTQAQPASTATAATNVVSPAATDFTELLMQLLTPADAQAAPMLSAAVASAFKEQEDAPTEEDAAHSDLAIMMAALPSVPLEARLEAAVSTTDTAAQSAGGLTSQGSKQDLSLLARLQTTLAEQQSTLEAAAIATDAPTTLEVPTDFRLPPSGLDGIKDMRLLPNAEAPVQRQMHTPVGTPQWNDELGTQVRWLAERGHQAASIRLAPEHLGPLEVRISIQDDRASVWFGAAHADTRAAIENALPRLREMLAAEGLSLNDAGVFREPPRQQQAYSPVDSSATHESVESAERTQSSASMLVGLIDAYA